MATYLDFEQKLKTLQDDIQNAQLRGDEAAIKILQNELSKSIKNIYAKLTDYQLLQLARHPDRPYALDYVEFLLSDAYEIFGDRHFRDDKAIVGFIGKISTADLGAESSAGSAAKNAIPVMLIGEEKGRGTKNKLARNFGMPNPEGYRKALRLAKLAEKFGLPIVMLVDTSGAYPGIGAEERGQSEAIAKNLQEFAALKVPTISIVIGEGGSGGALAISVSDRLAMMQYSVFSVISPEGCAAILWSDPAKVETATKALKITPAELKKQKLIDDIIAEPTGGAHRDKAAAAAAIKEYVLKSLAELNADSAFLEKRYEKLMSYGAFA